MCEHVCNLHELAKLDRDYLGNLVIQLSPQVPPFGSENTPTTNPVAVSFSFDEKKGKINLNLNKLAYDNISMLNWICSLWIGHLIQMTLWMNFLKKINELNNFQIIVIAFNVENAWNYRSTLNFQFGKFHFFSQVNRETREWVTPYAQIFGLWKKWWRLGLKRTNM